MSITNELDNILDSENNYINSIKIDLGSIGESLTDKAEHDLRIGYRTKYIIDIKLSRARDERSNR